MFKNDKLDATKTFLKVRWFTHHFDNDCYKYYDILVYLEPKIIVKNIVDKDEIEFKNNIELEEYINWYLERVC